jgi:hypothetical protein
MYIYIYIIYREKIEKRIEMNVSMAEEIEEKRKNEFLDKQEHFERIRIAHLQQLDQDRYIYIYHIYYIYVYMYMYGLLIYNN